MPALLLPERALLVDRKLNTLALGEGDHGAVAVADDEAGGEAGGEGVSGTVLDVDDIEGSEVPFAGNEHTNTARIASLGNHDQVAYLEGDNVNNLSSGNIELDGVVNLDEGVGKANGPAVVGGDLGDLLGANLFLGDLAELELGLLIVQSVEHEASLGIVEETEGIASLGDGHDVHETSGEAGVRADLAIDLNVPLHADGEGLASVKSVLETVTEDKNEGRHSRSLWGPVEGRGAQIPPILESIQCLGAFSLLRCFFGPRAMVAF